MDFIVTALFGILGATLISGGIVAYRRSTRTSVRALDPAAVAAGVVRWLVVLLILSVSVTRGS